ncbi:MAG: DUF2167 domain-containing protein [Gammaproteobacteria bacterium]|nr:MAG: DUF2167 domain-containing protein [Gammaproteobacteria bacterium]
MAIFSFSIAAQATDQLPQVDSASEATQPTPEAVSPAQDGAQTFLASLKFQTGKITLPNGIATIDLPTNFHYLPPEDSEKLLVEGWGNPPGNNTLGMIIPTETNPLSQSGWGVVITYDEDGHVKDEDADKIDYTSLLKTMQEESEAANKERVKQGYGAMHLVGWAEPPSYDKTARKLVWAKEYSSDKQGEHSLNYNIRVLGRKGVLVLNAVAGMNQISQIKSEMPLILAVTEFSKGNRYADFDSKTDHTAEYGIAALVAGGVAAKMGLFAKLGVFLLAFKKFIIIGFVALAAFLRSVFSRKSGK